MERIQKKEDLSYYEKMGRKLFCFCWFAYCVSYIGRYNYSACMTSMIEAGIFNESFGGVISACFLVSYGAGQLSNGIIGDKVHPKYMIGFGLLGSGIANVLMGFSFNEIYSCIVWCMNGYFCSMLWSPLIRCFAEFLLIKQRMKAAVNIAATIPAGSLLCYGASSLVLKISGWRFVFISFGVVLAASFAIWFFGLSTSSMKEYFVKIKQKKIELGEGIKNHQNGAGSMHLNKIALLIATGAAFATLAVICNGMLKESITQFVPKYLYDVFGVDGAVASAISMILPVINLFGAYVANYLLTRIFKNELTTASVLFAFSAASSVLLYTVGRYHVILAAMFVAFTTSAMLGVNTLLLTFIPLSYSGVGLSSTFTGFLDAMAYIASASATAVFGVVSASKMGWDGVVVLWGIIGIIGVSVCIIGSKKWKTSKTQLNENTEEIIRRYSKG